MPILGLDPNDALTAPDSGTQACTRHRSPTTLGGAVGSAHEPTDADLDRLGTLRKLHALSRAWEAAQLRIPGRVMEVTGESVVTLLHELLPGLLTALGVVAAATAIGGTLGAVAGFFFGGVGAAPGAVLGANAGFDLANAALAVLGIGFLIHTAITGLGTAESSVQRALWHAYRSELVPATHRDEEVGKAADLFADAVAQLLLVVLCAVVVWITRRSASGMLTRVETSTKVAATAIESGERTAAEARVIELVTRLRQSKLGSGFADWVELNWRRLISNPRLQPRQSATRLIEAPREFHSPSQLRAAMEGDPVIRVREEPSPPTVSNKPGNWDALTSHPDSHAFEVHGGDVTDADLAIRARTGVKPDGTQGPIPPLSSAFHSDDLLISTDQAIRNQGGLAHAIARQPGQTVVRVEVQDVGDLGSNLGRGYARPTATGNAAANASAVGPLQRIDGLRSAQGIYELNGVTGVWETITVYPAPF